MKRIGKPGVVIALLIVTAIALFIAFQARPASAQDTDLTFETSPLEVEVSVDGQQYGTVASGETITVPLEVEADIEITREGFRPYSSTVEITPGVPHTVSAALHPETQEAAALIEAEHEGSVEKEVTEQYLEDAERAYDEYPILEQLPMHGELYSVYQGLAETSGQEFAIHLYLYKGHEAQGRDAFQDWMKSEGYQIEDYEVVEHIEDEAPPSIVLAEPSWDELLDLQPSDIEIATEVSTAEMTPEEAAVAFAEVTTTWDAAKDVHSTDGLKRATDLMTSDAVDSVFTPENPATSPTWREAMQYEARSTSWVTYYEDSKHDEETKIELDVCWAWVTEGEHVIIDGPRAYETTVVETGKGPQISSFVYDDPDPFVDNSDNPCRPEDAPPAP